MKKLVIITIMSFVSMSVFSQNIDNLQTGLSVTELTKDYTHFTYSSSQFKKISDNVDSLIYQFIIDTNDKDVLFVIAVYNTLDIVKTVAINIKSGLIVVNKKELEPGSYYCTIYTSGQPRNIGSFDVNSNYEAKKQVGNYIIYWKDNKFKIKYVGLD